jgi:precorrin-6B methylase 2
MKKTLKQSLLNLFNYTAKPKSDEHETSVVAIGIAPYQAQVDDDISNESSAVNENKVSLDDLSELFSDDTTSNASTDIYSHFWEEYNQSNAEQSPSETDIENCSLKRLSTGSIHMSKSTSDLSSLLSPTEKDSLTETKQKQSESSVKPGSLRRRSNGSTSLSRSTSDLPDLPSHNNDNQATTEQEQKLIDYINKCTSTWFDTFVQHTNQKEETARLFYSLFTKLRRKDYPLDKVLDIGCGNGSLSAKIVSILTQLNPLASYEAIEYDIKYVRWVLQALKETHIERHKIVLGNCFGKDIKELSNDANIIIVSNVAYYAKDISSFCEEVIKKLKKENSLVVFIHESSSSDMNTLRSKYGAKVQTDTVNEIEKYLRDQKVEYYNFTIESELEFPLKSIEHIKSLAYECKLAGVTTNGLNDIQMLVEFVVQTPLFYLRGKVDRGSVGKKELGDKLNDYLTEIIDLLSKQNMTLRIKSEVQIATLSKSVEAFKEAMGEICNELKDEYGPKANEFPNGDKNLRRSTSELPISNISGNECTNRLTSISHNSVVECALEKFQYLLKENDREVEDEVPLMCDSYLPSTKLNKVSVEANKMSSKQI